MCWFKQRKASLELDVGTVLLSVLFTKAGSVDLSGPWFHEGLMMAIQVGYILDDTIRPSTTALSNKPSIS